MAYYYDVVSESTKKFLEDNFLKIKGKYKRFNDNVINFYHDTHILKDIILNHLEYVIKKMKENYKFEFGNTQELVKLINDIGIERVEILIINIKGE